MAIETDDGILKFGTKDEVTVASPSAVDGNGGISTSSDINEWTNDDDTSLVTFVLNATFAVAPSNTRPVQIHCTLCEVNAATDDEPAKDAAYNGHFLVNVFPDAVTTSQYLVSRRVALPAMKASQIYQFYITNDQADATKDISSGWSLWAIPCTHGPHA